MNNDGAFACEGECKPCIGAVRRMRVTDPSTGKDWGNFWYCDTAVSEDLRNGLKVEDAEGVK